MFTFRITLTTIVKTQANVLLDQYDSKSLIPMRLSLHIPLGLSYMYQVGNQLIFETPRSSIKLPPSVAGPPDPVIDRVSSRTG